VWDTNLFAAQIHSISKHELGDFESLLDVA